MEKLESLDKKAIEEQYIASYHYSAGQKLMAGIAVIVIILGLLIVGTFLFLSIINKITG
jgi:cytochrome b subunit of formate dehydrogenase